MVQDKDTKLEDFFNDFVNLSPENQALILSVSKKLLAIQRSDAQKPVVQDEGEADDSNREGL
jgi:hypothetical protein